MLFLLNILWYQFFLTTHFSDVLAETFMCFVVKSKAKPRWKMYLSRIFQSITHYNATLNYIQ